MKKITFPKHIDFDITLKNRVNTYLKENNIKETGTKFMQMKGGIFFISAIILYYFLVFKTENILTAFILTFFLIQSQILLAFNVMHDAGHGAFSSKKWLNNLGSFTLELLGASSNLWKQKHNILHHTYTNVYGKDDDLDIGSLMRLSPTQKKQPWHRYQYIYAPFLYGFLSLYLLFYSDFQKMITKKIGTTPLKPQKTGEFSIFIISKIFYIFYALILPMIFHNPLIVLGYFLFAHFIFGLTISLVFQLAHTVNETDFPIPNETGYLPFLKT